jgi:hypothetical protein
MADEEPRDTDETLLGRESRAIAERWRSMSANRQTVVGRRSGKSTGLAMLLFRALNDTDAPKCHDKT